MRNPISFLLIILGLSCSCAQILFIREFLIVFYGNELTIGLLLAIWLLLAATGSYIFGRLKIEERQLTKIYGITQILTGILFPLCLFFARIIKNILGISPGEGLGILPTIISSALVMLPLAGILGGQFPLASRLYRSFADKGLAYALGKSYFLESVGFALGAVSISYFFIPRLNPMQIAFIISWLNITCAFILMTQSKKLKTVILFFCLLAGAVTAAFAAEPLNRLSLKWQWKDLNLIESRNSVYGNIAVIKQQEQHVFFYDGLPFMTVPIPDLAFTEDMTIFPLSCAENPKQILVLGTGLGGIINNIFRFPVESVDYAELDPAIIDLVKKHPSPLTSSELTDRRLFIHLKDGRQFLKDTNKDFDAIILNLPMPSTLAINRYYTKEFFELIKKHLRNKGIFCLSLPGSLSYLAEEQVLLNKCIFATLRTVFSCVEIIPGDYNIYLACPQKQLRLEKEKILSYAAKSKTQSAFFSDFYIKERLKEESRLWFMRSITAGKALLNSDLKPAGVFYSLGLWNALFSPGFQKIFACARSLNVKTIFFIIFLLTIILFFAGKNKNASGLIPLLSLTFSGGFTGLSLNLILILALQNFYGYFYQYVGLLLGTFMAGLTCGSFFVSNRIENIKNPAKTLLGLDGIFIAVCFIFPLLVLLAKTISQESNFFALTLFLSSLSAIIGLLIGGEFPLVNKILLGGKKESRQVSFFYSADLAGSFLGSLLTAFLFVPLLGIIDTILIIAALKLSFFTLFATSFFSLGRKRL